MPTPDRGPNVRFPPPIVFVAGFGLGAYFERIAPLPFQVPGARMIVLIGLIVFAAGIALAATGIDTFRRHDTAIYPNQSARTLVTGGVYAYTRNPMYLGLTMAYVGAIAATGLAWPLLLLPLVLGIIVTQVIRREEAHLHERFPEEYAMYSARVRRWL